MNDRTCRVCGGSGYTYEGTVKARDPVSFVFMIVEAVIPFAGKKVRCYRCKGKGYYQPQRYR